jgi:hypothetical protein
MSHRQSLVIPQAGQTLKPLHAVKRSKVRMLAPVVRYHSRNHALSVLGVIRLNAKLNAST